jgi:hypothetical protein
MDQKLGEEDQAKIGDGELPKPRGFSQVVRATGDPEPSVAVTADGQSNLKRPRRPMKQQDAETAPSDLQGINSI